MIGQVIGQYRIVEKIGQGGMGEVYKAVDINLDRPVAIKVLSKDLLKDESLLQRFRSEAKTQAQLNHPNICTLYSFLKFQDNLFMVMEFVEGLTLEQMIRQRGPLPYQEAIPIFQQVLFGLSKAHRMGIIHRDLKPANIIVNREGVTKIMDFGIARVMGESRLTRTGLAVGTLFYMPPEQIQGKDVDFRGDIYALGLTLYEVLTGTLPFRANTEYEIMQAHVRETPAPPSKVYPYLPKTFDKAILKALEKDPARRYQTVEEFSQALGQALQEALRTTPPPVAAPTAAYTAAAGIPAATMAATAMAPRPKPGFLGLNRNQLIIAGSSAVFVVLAVIIIGLWLLLSGPKSPTPVSGTQEKAATASSGRNTAQPPPVQKSVLETKSGSTSTDLDVDKLPGMQPAPDRKESQPQAEKPASRPAPKRSAEATPPSTPAPQRPSPPESAPAEKSTGSSAAVPQNTPSQTVDPIRQLQQQAYSAYQTQRYYAPPRNNALYFLAEVLKRDPGNSYALGLKNEVLQLCQQQVETLVNQNNYPAARQVCQAVLQYVPNDEDFLDILSGLQGMEEDAKQVSQAATFLVAHDHSGSFLSFCVGTLYILPDRVMFRTSRSTDGRTDDFDVSRSQIKEFSTNRWPIGGYRCFHIKLTDGRNFNFAHIDPNGTDLGADVVVNAYQTGQ